MTQLDIFHVHEHEPKVTQEHLTVNRDLFSDQCRMIYDHLIEYGSITGVEAWHLYGITRCASRIHDLKKNGVKFVEPAPKVKVGKTSVCNYQLEKK